MTGGIISTWRLRLAAALAALCALLIVSLAASAGSASAAVPAKTDVMFIFDTSGSMQGVLEESKEQINTLIANTEKNLPSVEFGVANVEDIPEQTLTEKQYEEDPEKPWALWQPLTTDQAKVEEAVNNLSGEEVAHAGGDLPEAYGRALYETATNPRVGWRPGARHEIVLIADNVPHTPNVNEGIPSELWLANPFETGEEPEGKFGIPGTIWKAGETEEFHHTLAKLSAEEKPLAMVNYFHTGESEEINYLHYWEYWAADTGGQAIQTEEGTKSLDAKLESIIKESAEGIPPCAPGYERGATTPCVKKASSPSPAPASTPPAVTPPPPVIILTAPPKEVRRITVYLEEEVGGEYEFPEAGEGEADVEVLSAAEAARFGGDANVSLLAEQASAKKCKKNYVRKDGRCVSKAPLVYGRLKFTMTAAGKHKFRFKPNSTVRSALRKGKTLHVRFKLVFVPAGTKTRIVKTAYVTLHLKKKHHK